MAYLANLAATTELEAVNAMMAAIGEAPVATVDAANPDVARALEILKGSSRELQSRRWRFNTEFGYTLTGTTFSGGYVYPAPTGLLSFDLSRTEAQRGMDVVLRPSRTYLVAGNRVMILADRLNASDTFAATTLKIDPVWLYDFELLPEAARKVITIMSCRRMAQSIGSTDIAGLTAQDEQIALQALVEDQRGQTPVVPAGTALSELDAVNKMLMAAGKDPVVSLLSGLSPEAVSALNRLRSVTREVQTTAWQFNTEFGYELRPSASYVYTDAYGASENLSVFKPPVGMVSWTLTNAPHQQGPYYLDLALAPSQTYLEAGQPVLVFRERATNRDGFARDYLHINPSWSFPFDKVPESARHYITVRATRQFCDQMGVDTALKVQDERQALRELKRDQGAEDDYNIFSNYSVLRVLGDRPFGVMGVRDGRSTPR